MPIDQGARPVYAVTESVTDTFVLVTYPWPGRTVRVCTVWYDVTGGYERDSHCWVPKNPTALGEIDVWKNFRWDRENVFLGGRVTVERPTGVLETIYLWPRPEEGPTAPTHASENP